MSRSAAGRVWSPIEARRWAKVGGAARTFCDLCGESIRPCNLEGHVRSRHWSDLGLARRPRSYSTRWGFEDRLAILRRLRGEPSRWFWTEDFWLLIPGSGEARKVRRHLHRLCAVGLVERRWVDEFRCWEYHAAAVSVVHASPTAVP